MIIMLSIIIITFNLNYPSRRETAQNSKNLTKIMLFLFQGSLTHYYKIIGIKINLDRMQIPTITTLSTKSNCKIYRHRITVVTNITNFSMPIKTFNSKILLNLWQNNLLFSIIKYSINKLSKTYSTVFSII